MDKYEEMLKRADEKYHFSGLEKRKIISLLDYCHANDVRWTFRRTKEFPNSAYLPLRYRI